MSEEVLDLDEVGLDLDGALISNKSKAIWREEQDKFSSSFHDIES
jgi:hypothetical protein